MKMKIEWYTRAKKHLLQWCKNLCYLEIFKYYYYFGIHISNIFHLVVKWLEEVGHSCM